MPPSFKDAGDYRPRLFVHTNQLRPGELLELAPRLGAHVDQRHPDRSDIVIPTGMPCATNWVSRWCFRVRPAASSDGKWPSSSSPWFRPSRSSILLAARKGILPR